MTGIKAIDTEYNGHRFRSRLEARWAVFFDSAGIGYQYEPEGFDLPGGDRYLPDFWLPVQELWVEIKPTEPTERENRVAAKLAEMTNHIAVILAGNVWPTEYIATVWCVDGEFCDGLISGWRLAPCRRCDGLDLLCDEGWGEIGKHTCGDHESCPVDFEAVHYEAARSARFDRPDARDIEEARQQAIWDQLSEDDRVSIRAEVLAENPGLRKWEEFIRPLCLARVDALVSNRRN